MSNSLLSAAYPLMVLPRMRSIRTLGSNSCYAFVACINVGCMLKRSLVWYYTCPVKNTIFTFTKHRFDVKYILQITLAQNNNNLSCVNVLIEDASRWFFNCLCVVQVVCAHCNCSFRSRVFQVHISRILSICLLKHWYCQGWQSCHLLERFEEGCISLCKRCLFR